MKGISRIEDKQTKMTWIRNNCRKWRSMRIAIVSVFLLIFVLAGCSGGAVQRGWSGGGLDGNTLYLGSRDGKLIAVNIADNSREWVIPLETGTTSAGLGCSRAAIVSYIYGTPAVSDNMIYVGGYLGKVYSFIPGEAQPDRTLDRVRVGDKDVLIGPIEGSLTISDANIYFGSTEGRVYAINDRLQPIWSEPFQTKGKIVSSPTVVNGVVYIGSFDKKLYALDAATGTLKWDYETKGVFVASPVVDGNTVYAVSFDKHVYALNATNGELLWSFTAGNGFWATPVVHNGQVYAPCLDGKVYVLKAGDGSRVTDINVGGPVSSSPVIVGNNLILATQESKGSATVKKGAAIWAIDLGSNQGREVTRLEGDTVAAPLAGNDQMVFVHTYRDTLFGIDIESGAKREFSIK